MDHRQSTLSEPFFNGLTKQAGLFDSIKNVWSRLTGKTKKNTQEKNQPVYEKTPPKMFYSKKLSPEFAKGLNKAMKQNYKDQQQSVRITYEKANGEQVKRTITPYTAKHQRVVVGYDHTRGALRSFRVDRIKSMETL